jgi:hypothetical protein
MERERHHDTSMVDGGDSVSAEGTLVGGSGHGATAGPSSRLRGADIGDRGGVSPQHSVDPVRIRKELRAGLPLAVLDDAVRGVQQLMELEDCVVQEFAEELRCGLCR